MERISVLEALEWLGRMAVADGVLTRRERAVLRDFGKRAGLEVSDYIDHLAGVGKLMPKEVVPVEDARHEEGRSFENFVIRSFLKKPVFSLVSRSSDVVSRFIRMDERSKSPDLFVKFFSGVFAHNIWIECKWSRSWSLFIKLGQLERFASGNVSGRAPVFFMFGRGGSPELPDNLYLIPLHHILTQGITRIKKTGDKVFVIPEVLPRYEIMPENFIAALRKYM